MGRHRTLSEDEVMWAYRRWLEGYTQTDIARALYTSQRVISYSFRRKGLKKTKAKIDYWEVNQ